MRVRTRDVGAGARFELSPSRRANADHVGWRNGGSAQRRLHRRGSRDARTGCDRIGRAEADRVRHTQTFRLQRQH